VNLIEKLEARNGAMKVAELCELLGVDDKHIYRMAARGSLPCFQEVAKWLRSKYGVVLADDKKPPVPVQPLRRQERHIA